VQSRIGDIDGREVSREAKEARKYTSHFVALLEENGLWDELVKLRDANREPPSNLNPTDWQS